MEADMPICIVDFDFCDSCVSNPDTRQTHDVSHVLFPIMSPGPRAKEAFNNARKVLQQPPAPVPSSEAQHITVHCDGCEQYPIVGVRHKCLDCNGQYFHALTCNLCSSTST